MALRFIHCADLHLGTPFKAFPGRYGNEPDLIKKVLSAPEKTLDKIVQCAISQKVDFVLFAGDIMNSVNANWRSISVFSGAVRRMKEANIQSFVIAGNHDAMPNAALSDACKDAILFPTDEVSYYEIPGKAVIGGISFCEKKAADNLALQFKRQNQELFHIALYHGDIGSQKHGTNVYNPALLSDLLNANFDYWALGHIHEKAVLSSENPLILYSGATVSHHVNEISPKGFYLIEVDDFKHIKTEFIETSPIAFVRLEIDLTDADDLNQIPETIKKKLSELPPSQTIENCFLEIIFSGMTSLDRELNLQKNEDLYYFISSNLAEKYKVGNIEIKTSNAADTEAFIKENIFASDLHRSFEYEKSVNFPTLSDDVAIFQRTYGTLFEAENIDMTEISENAEKELLRLLTEAEK